MTKVLMCRYYQPRTCVKNKASGLSCHQSNPRCRDYEPFGEQQAVVVNIKTDLYDALIDRTTIFGNPFKEWQWGREECIRKFETYFYQRLERDAEFKAKVLELKGKRLGCHCYPLPCHGDIIVEYLNTYDKIQEIREKK